MHVCDMRACLLTHTRVRVRDEYYLVGGYLDAFLFWFYNRTYTTGAAFSVGLDVES
jgi:hypothetical protein